MQHSYTAIYLHIVFAVSGRRPMLPGIIGERVHAYLATLCRDKQVDVYRVGGAADHVHLAVAIRSDISIPDLLRHLKSNSSRVVRDTFDRRFAWQRGYGAFSVSPTAMPRLVRYIERQEEHHRKRSSREELRLLLESYGVKRPAVDD